MTTQVEINAPLNKVFDLFTDKSRFTDWKVGFVGYEHVKGTPGEEGAVTKLTYKRYVMNETVQKKDKPRVYTSTYEYLQHGKTMMEHTSQNKFTAVGDNKTRLEVTSDVTKVNGFFTKIMVKLMAKAGEKQFRDQLALFKTMVEKG